MHRMPIYFFAALASLLASAASRADHYVVGTPDRFIQRLGDESMGILCDDGLTRAQKERRFHELYRRHFDTRWIAQGIVGSPWRSATTSERAGLEGRVSRYVPDKLVVKLWAYRKATFRADWFGTDGADVVVHSTVVDPKTNQGVTIHWRLVAEGNSWRVRDVSIAGFSLRLTEQRLFKELFDRFGRTLDGLLQGLDEELRSIARIELRG